MQQTGQNLRVSYSFVNVAFLLSIHSIVNNMIWSLQIELPEPQKPTVMERLRRQQRAKLSRRESYTSRVVNMATESVAQAAHHQKQRRSLHSKYRPSQSGSEREDSLSSPSPEPVSFLCNFCVVFIVDISYQSLVKVVWRRSQQLRQLGQPKESGGSVLHIISFLSQNNTGSQNWRQSCMTLNKTRYRMVCH